MGRVISIAAVFCVGLLLALYVIDPAASIMMLAGHGALYAVMRCVIVAILLTLLFKRPPRRKPVRAMTGSLAAGLSLWTAIATYGERLRLLDGLSLLALGVCVGLYLVEPSRTDKPLRAAATRIMTLLHTHHKGKNHAFAALLNGAHKLLF